MVAVGWRLRGLCYGYGWCVAGLWVGGAMVWLLLVLLVVGSGGLLVGLVGGQGFGVLCVGCGLARCGRCSMLGQCEGSLAEGGWWRWQWG